MNPKTIDFKRGGAEENQSKNLNSAIEELIDTANRWARTSRLLWVFQAYATTTAIVASTLLAALASPAKSERYGVALLVVISLHLAVTQGLHKAFKIEKFLADAKATRADFLAFYFQLRHRPEEYVKDGAADVYKRIEAFSKRFGELDGTYFPETPDRPSSPPIAPRGEHGAPSEKRG